MIHDILRSNGTYSENEVSLFKSAVLHRHFTKGEVIFKQGDITRSVYYLIDGTAYQINSVETIDQIIDLHTKGTWVLNYNGLISQEPSQTTLKAFTDGTLLELNLEAIHYLIGKSIAFLQLNKIIATATTRLEFFDAAMTPLQKYTYIMIEKPQLIQVFPLKYIASYLKIAPETLSRVRERWVNDGNIS